IYAGCGRGRVDFLNHPGAGAGMAAVAAVAGDDKVLIRTQRRGGEGGVTSTVQCHVRGEGGHHRLEYMRGRVEIVRLVLERDRAGRSRPSPGYRSSEGQRLAGDDGAEIGVRRGKRNIDIGQSAEGEQVAAVQ